MKQGFFNAEAKFILGVTSPKLVEIINKDFYKGYVC